MAVHCQLLFTTILYFVVFITGLVQLCTLAGPKRAFGGDNSFSGECYLYVKFEGIFVREKPPDLSCDLIIYANAAASIYAFVMAIYHGYGTFVASKDAHIGRTMWVMPWLLLNALATFVIFICALVYSFGFYITCQNVISATSIKDCYQALIPIRWLEHSSFNKSVYESMQASEIAGWISVMVWCALIALETIRLFRNRRAKKEQMYIDPTTSDTIKITDMPSPGLDNL